MERAESLLVRWATSPAIQLALPRGLLVFVLLLTTLFLFLRMRLHLLLLPVCLRPISRLPLKCSWPLCSGHGGVTAIGVCE